VNSYFISRLTTYTDKFTFRNIKNYFNYISEIIIIYLQGNKMKRDRESLSSDKIESLKGILFGSRVYDFTNYWKSVPSVENFQKNIKDNLEAIIFDLDGTLVAPYADIDENIFNLLKSYKTKYKVIIFSNSPSSDRLIKLQKRGIDVVQSDLGKPSLEAFENVCIFYGIDSCKTAMIGNFPLTDMPLVKNGETSFFPINILIKSIPPKRSLLKSNRKFLRAYLFHLLAVFITMIVKFRKKF